MLIQIKYQVCAVRDSRSPDRSTCCLHIWAPGGGARGPPASYRPPSENSTSSRLSLGDEQKRRLHQQHTVCRSVGDEQKNRRRKTDSLVEFNRRIWVEAVISCQLLLPGISSFSPLRVLRDRFISSTVIFYSVFTFKHMSPTHLFLGFSF